jgi:16S rRNA (uracil1498-N3)-methyltransferase
MPAPYFYIEEISDHSSQLVLNEETSRHVIQVLRMKKGERLNLTNGKGLLLLGEITAEDRKKCQVNILRVENKPRQGRQVTIAVSPIKNASRFEWFMEKATELGIYEIVPLVCSRTEKQHFRHDRMKNILVSAMLQSQQSWLPFLQEPENFKDYVASCKVPVKLIGHCEDDKQKVSITSFTAAQEICLLIGPEGDFTTDEVNKSMQHGFVPVHIGDTRLRTETAAIAGAAILCIR